MSQWKTLLDDESLCCLGGLGGGAGPVLAMPGFCCCCCCCCCDSQTWCGLKLKCVVWFCCGCEEDGGAVIDAVVDAVCGDLAEWGVELSDMGLGPVPTPAAEVVVATVVQPPPFHTSGGGLPPLDDALLLGPLLNGGEWMVSLWVITGSM